MGDILGHDGKQFMLYFLMGGYNGGFERWPDHYEERQL